MTTPSNSRTGFFGNGKGLSKNTAILMLCMGIAFFLWLIVQMSDTYVAQVPIDINYINLPTDSIAVIPLPHQGRAQVRATGFRLLFAQMSIRKPTIEIDHQDHTDERVIHSQDLLQSMANNMPQGFNLLSMQPDTILLAFEPLSRKKVPVQLIDNISIAKQYGAKDQIVLKPDSIEIEGPSMLIDSIDVWYTDTLQLTEVKNSITDTLSLSDPQYGSIEISPAQVNYTLEIEPYTEAMVKVPVTLLNVPKGVEITTYPKEVEVRFMVGLSDHDKALNSIFEVVADLQGIDLTGDELLTLKLVQQPTYVKNPALFPTTAEYIIYK